MSNPNPKHRFVKGESGNPAGRPKGVFNFTPELRSQLNEVDPNDRFGRTYGQVIVAKAIQMAKKGHIRAINEIADRLEGKPAQNVTLDARVVTQEERAANILQNLTVLKSLADDEPSDTKVN